MPSISSETPPSTPMLVHDKPITSSGPLQLTLASASPRRRELLALLGVPFQVVPSRYEEPSAPKEPIALDAFVSKLAEEKAREVAGRVSEGIIIGADTLVTLDDGTFSVPLGKPADAEDAQRMLRLLSGRTHSVLTGVALIWSGSDSKQTLLNSVVQTRVRFRELTDAMIRDYIATGEPLDKAGAYGAQGYAAPFVERFDGDFYNVVGLPLCELGKLLERAGFDWRQQRNVMPPLIG